MFNSDYQVQTLSGGQLQVIASPYYSFAYFSIITGMILAVFFTSRIIKSGSLYPALGLLIAAPFLCFGGRGFRAGTMTLDKAAETATFHRPTTFGNNDWVVPLQKLRFATIRTMRASSYIAVVLDSGDEMTFADSTDQGGKGRAVVAINQYLGAGDH